MVLPGLELAAATPVLKSLRTAVAKHQWSTLIDKLPLTVSIGASAAAPRDTQSTLLARADHNLYAAKSAGRNRVVVEQRPLSAPLAASSLATGRAIGRRLAPP